jgi:S-adenosylmethionine synthetase
MNLIVSALPRPTPAERSVEVVERKGLGHPDSLCDALAEAFSLALCRYYHDHFGAVLHHNVDKLLLAAGVSRPAFGGGDVVEPIRLYLAGRATSEVGADRVPVEAIARQAVLDWCANNLHALDPERHLEIIVLARPSSPDLVELFRRRPEAGARLANDTSIGVGYAPLSPLERATLAVERALNTSAVCRSHPAIGEDV